MPEYTNKLIHETSPYLLQHAHNPVQWYPWSEEAFQKAVAENKPVLVSIGYAACHWCHVMERESFENAEVAEYMNRHFVNIKVDREERPDIDHIYMDAVQLMSGSGGWPLNVFLTPDKKPFYGGTYFPPVGMYNRPSWMQILQAVADAFANKQEEITTQSDYILSYLKQSVSPSKKGNNDPFNPFSEQTVKSIYEKIMQQADTTWGGFGRAPKFPGTFTLQYLLRYYYFSRDEKALQQVLISLDKMIQGGIYDQLGGGFSRYSTDNKWQVPHFEKMLYDNALLITALAEAYQITGRDEYREIIGQTMHYLQREMMSPENGFYSAQDADAEGEEGKYYVWSEQELRNILQDDAAIFCEYYHVLPGGNWEGKNILYRTDNLGTFAKSKKWDTRQLQENFLSMRQKLLEVRNKRTKPLLDDKIILGWNALMITACCKAFAAIGDIKYKTTAEDAMSFLLNNMQTTTGSYHHVYKDGIAKYPAFLDDYAFLIQALIHLQEITGNKEYLIKAAGLMDTVIDHFYDQATGYFFYTPDFQDDIIVRKKEIYDGATPSGNAVMAANLHYLGVILDNRSYLQMTQNMIADLSAAITDHPASFSVWAAILLEMTVGTWEIAIVGQEYLQKLQELIKAFIPWKVLQSGTTTDNNFPLLQGKGLAGNTLLYLCENYACLEPVTEVNLLLDKIRHSPRKINN